MIHMSKVFKVISGFLRNHHIVFGQFPGRLFFSPCWWQLKYLCFSPLPRDMIRWEPPTNLELWTPRVVTPRYRTGPRSAIPCSPTKNSRNPHQIALLVKVFSGGVFQARCGVETTLDCWIFFVAKLLRVLKVFVSFAPPVVLVSNVFSWLRVLRCSNLVFSLPWKVTVRV